MHLHVHVCTFNVYVTYMYMYYTVVHVLYSSTCIMFPFLTHMCRAIVFSVNVLKEERVVVVAEQKPNCSDEEVWLLLPSVV